jgi:transcription elongation GreA/GreB family factor
MDKAFLSEQLGAKLRENVHHAQKTLSEAAQDARSGADRAVNIAKGQMLRTERVRAELDAIENFRPKPLGKGATVVLGALIEIEGDDSGRTLFLAPAGAGLELTGPDGDGFFSVVTPQSPIGRALMGKRVGDTFDVMDDGEPLEYTITWLG